MGTGYLRFGALSAIFVLTACGNDAQPFADDDGGEGGSVDVGGGSASGGDDASGGESASGGDNASGGDSASGGAGGSIGCNDAGDCDDSSACTVDSCDQGLCVNALVDVDDDDACTVDSCDALTGVAHDAIDPDDNDVCTFDVCDPVNGVANVSAITLFSDDFANNSQGWILGTEWQIGPALVSSGGQWGADPGVDHSASNDNGVAGVVIGGNATTALHGFYYLVSPPTNTMVTQGEVVLSYWRWLNGDYDPYMTNVVQVFDGTQWLTIWESGLQPGVEDSPPFGSGWVEYSFTVTQYANPAFRVRFGHDVTQSGAYPIGSWNLDDVSIVNVPEPVDGDPCTVDSCDPIAGAVTTPVSMDDQSLCTNDQCNMTLAVYHGSINPNDNNACTMDSCNPQTGVSNTVISCNDNNACTSDACSPNSGCSNSVIPQPHNKCSVGPAGTPLLNCPSDPCVQAVCQSDPFCCNTDWNQQCVNEVFSVCQSKSCSASAGSCSHTLCTTGSTLVSGCDSGSANCVQQICAVDSFCCTTEWDSICVGQVASVCGLNCN
jgi:hypothetical protein